MKQKESPLNEKLKVKPRERLTNEKLKSEFSNQFDLVICAIGIARDIIAEKAVSMQYDNQNSAVQALAKLNDKEQ